MKNFELAKWIWPTSSAQPDEYAEFIEEIDFFGKRASINISADSNYVVYVNGSIAAFGQYADFPYDKVYDTHDISHLMRQGKNILAIRVWYYGIETAQGYYKGEAGVIYSVELDGHIAINSSGETLSRISPTYRNHECKQITAQLGISFSYDARQSDGWLFGEPSERHPFASSYETGVSLPLRPRTCLPLQFGESVIGVPVPADKCTPVSKNGMIFDLGRENVGFITLDFITEGEQTITVAFGEHLEDGHVRAHVGGRDFTFTYTAEVGRNYYMNPFRRFGCRYVELIPEKPISSASVGIRNTVYPVTQLPRPDGLTGLQAKIYDTCVYTLICCMHEHYEDCPWREQALYTMDSRNQMLAGYYAFGEYLFPKANLELIAADNRADGLLSICYPVNRDMVIPSFSLHFITQCEEYLRYSGDIEFIRKIYPKMRSVLGVFLSLIGENGLVAPLGGRGKWNFYEWTPGLDGSSQLGHGVTPEGLEPDLILNALISIALKKISVIEEKLGISTDALDLRERINAAINRTFFDEERGVYKNRSSEQGASKLGNALAILSGAAGERASCIAEALTGDTLTNASLSMQCFVYDALLYVDSAKYKNYVLNTIEKTYIPMIEYGNGTVWETELGASDFENAGSLCHGWSAIPIYYYNLFFGEKND